MCHPKKLEYEFFPYKRYLLNRERDTRSFQNFFVLRMRDEENRTITLEIVSIVSQTLKEIEAFSLCAEYSLIHKAGNCKITELNESGRIIRYD